MADTVPAAAARVAWIADDTSRYPASNRSRSEIVMYRSVPVGLAAPRKAGLACPFSFLATRCDQAALAALRMLPHAIRHQERKDAELRTV